MRGILIAGFAVAACSMIGCLSYPGLTDNTGATSDGGGTSTGGSGGGGGTGGDTTGPPAPGEDDPNDAENGDAPLAGTVVEQLCDFFVVIESDDGVRVFQSIDANFRFLDWEADDNVAIVENAGDFSITNNSRSQTIVCQPLGEFDVTTRFIDRNEITQSVELQDGSLWTFSGTRFAEVRLWLTGSDIISVARDAEGDFSGTLINHRRCTATAANEE